MKRPVAAALHLHRRFNPHPPLLAGETPSLHLLRWSVACFNPHPPLLAGETLLFEQVDTPAVVSIHTRHYWRVKRLQRGVRPERQLVSIHTRHYWRVKRREEDPEMEIRLVSIHTRHYWRVKPGTIERGEAPLLVSIHTRHYWRVKRPEKRLLARQNKFQSTPAITGG